MSNRQPDSAGSSSAWQDTLYYAKLPKLPKGVKWPVKLLHTDCTKPGFVNVYCHCDAQQFIVSVDHLEAFPNKDLEKKGIAGLKRKPNTRACFEADVKWASAEQQSQSGGPSKRLRVEKTARPKRKLCPGPNIDETDLNYKSTSLPNDTVKVHVNSRCDDAGDNVSEKRNHLDVNYEYEDNGKFNVDIANFCNQVSKEKTVNYDDNPDVETIVSDCKVNVRGIDGETENEGPEKKIESDRSCYQNECDHDMSKMVVNKDIVLDSEDEISSVPNLKCPLQKESEDNDADESDDQLPEDTIIRDKSDTNSFVKKVTKTTSTIASYEANDNASEERIQLNMNCDIGNVDIGSCDNQILKETIVNKETCDNNASEENVLIFVRYDENGNVDIVNTNKETIVSNEDFDKASGERIQLYVDCHGNKNLDEVDPSRAMKSNVDIANYNNQVLKESIVSDSKGYVSGSDGETENEGPEKYIVSDYSCNRNECDCDVSKKMVNQNNILDCKDEMSDEISDVPNLKCNLPKESKGIETDESDDHLPEDTTVRNTSLTKTLTIVTKPVTRRPKREFNFINYDDNADIVESDEGVQTENEEFENNIVIDKSCNGNECDRDNVCKKMITQDIILDSEDEMSDEISSVPCLKRHLVKESEEIDTDESVDHLPEDTIVRDINYTNIFVKRVTKTTNTGVKKKSDRTYDSYHSCPFCEQDNDKGKTMYSNFAQHVQRVHKKEPEVQMIMQETDEKKRSSLIAILRRKADHEHNVKVESNGKGEIILGRRFTNGVFTLKQYGPCPRCYEWLKVSGFLRHMKCCPVEVSYKESQGCLLIESRILTGRINSIASDTLVKEVFSIMKSDDVGKAAQHDDLIITIGNRWMEKLKGNEINRKYYTSSIMRLAARFLIELRKTKVVSLKENIENTLWDFIRPEHFDLCVSAAFVCAEQNTEDLEDLGSPSNAIKLGYELKRLVAAKLGYAIRAKDSDDKSDCRDFLELLQMEWGTRVTKLARITLNERKFNEQKSLPLPEDIEKLKDYLNHSLAIVDLEVSYACYRRACVLVQAKLVSYNRRRPGEIQQLKLRSYNRRVIGTKPVDHEMMRDLTKWERHLLDSQEVVETRGKTGRGVPVLLPPQTKEALKFITDPVVREKVGIRKENPYVFASANLGVIRAYESLSAVASESGLKIPEKITSTNLRKYCATISQVLDMSKNQLDWICEHLGHTVDVHRSHYRARSDVIERIEVAKVLMIQDFGCTKQFVGKQLEDIQFEEILYTNDLEKPEPSAMLPIPEENDEHLMEGSARADVFNFIDESDEEELQEDEMPKKRKKASVVQQRQKWTEAEENELKELLHKNFRAVKCPSQAECENARKASQNYGGLIWKRPRDNIKKKVSNMLKKL